MVPRKVHFFSGAATHPWHKNARDHASHAAGVADLNLVSTTEATELQKQKLFTK